MEIQIWKAITQNPYSTLHQFAADILALMINREAQIRFVHLGKQNKKHPGIKLTKYCIYAEILDNYINRKF